MKLLLTLSVTLNILFQLRTHIDGLTINVRNDTIGDLFKELQQCRDSKE